jgi:lipid II isoglutaminyl synthase (glutamine-hydrolysing)
MASLIDAKIALARGTGALARLRGSGATSLPGKLLMRIEPDAIGLLGARLAQGSALISATNGKTTTAAMASEILSREGMELVYNRAGANMGGGIATALLDAARADGTIAGQLGLFEVDEMWLAGVARELHPRAIVLGNLFRDQLDRFGELEAIAERWHELLAASAAAAVLNADDPLLADLGRERDDQQPTVFFGVEDDSLALPGLNHASDAKHCRHCGAPYAFDSVYLGHLGHYHCPGCGRVRPAPQVFASDVRLHGLSGSSFTLTTPSGRDEVQLQLPGLYNVYNALAAAALAGALGVKLEQVVSGLAATRPAFGRGETVSVALPAGGAQEGPFRRELRILLIKNPAGANEVLRTLALEPGEHELLGILNDQVADGRDVSWIWDADFELLGERIAHATCSGTRAADLAARLKYAGVPPQRITVEPDPARALTRAVGEGDPRQALYALPTYTAMLSLRELLVARGEAPSAWL